MASAVGTSLAGLGRASPGTITRFLLERPSDQRYNWIDARMSALSPAEARELITDAWRMVLPKRVAAGYLGSQGCLVG